MSITQEGQGKKTHQSDLPELTTSESLSFANTCSRRSHLRFFPGMRHLQELERRRIGLPFIVREHIFPVLNKKPYTGEAYG
jgi:hypothetical protein